MRSRILIFAVCSAVLLSALLLGGATSLPTAAAPAAQGGTLRFTEPNGQDDVVAEGDEFFTVNLADPVDMNNPEDVSTPSGWEGIPALPTTGIWSGRTAAPDARIFILHPGFNVAAPSLRGHSGQATPINASRYSHLVVKYSASARTNARAIWMAPGDPYTPGQFGGSCPIGVPGGEMIIDINLAACTAGNDPGWNSRAVWGGLAFDGAQGNVDADVKIDWMRLVPDSDPSSAFNAQWTCVNCARQTFDIYADTDNNPNNGGRVRLLTGVSGDVSAVDVPVGKLAPGDYYLSASGPTIPISYSPGPFTIRGKPILKVTAPSTTSGEDFATTVLGHAWDMTPQSPIALINNSGAWRYQNNTLHGFPVNNDPNIFLINGNTTIDTSRYVYLSFDLLLLRPPNIPENEFNEARVIWYPTNAPDQADTAGDMINYYDYWHHYVMDMRVVHQIAGIHNRWTGNPGVLRIEPAEEPFVGANPPANAPEYFLGQVRLTADPEATLGRATNITWTPLRGGGTVDLFYRLADGRTTTQFADDIPLSAGGYNWTVNVPEAGTYTIIVRASDGPSTATWSGDAPLVVKTPTQPPRPTATPTRAVPTNTPTPEPTATTGVGCIFSDVCPNNYWFEPVQTLIRLGAISGYSDNTYRPFNNTTRGQLAKIVVVAFGFQINTSGGPHFSDVPANNPFYAQIETAVNKGIISGYADGTYRWQNNVTRAQLAKIVVAAAGWRPNTTGGPHFSDVPTNYPFYEVIETAFSHGVISGYANGTFGPVNNATRAQISKIVALSLP